MAITFELDTTHDTEAIRDLALHELAHVLLASGYRVEPVGPAGSRSVLALAITCLGTAAAGLDIAKFIYDVIARRGVKVIVIKKNAERHVIEGNVSEEEVRSILSDIVGSAENK